MCDIVLAADDAYLQDAAHFPRGVVPGDGVHTVWPLVVGTNRARALPPHRPPAVGPGGQGVGGGQRGAPRDQLLDRAWELARYLALRPPLTLRLTRSILVQELRRAATEDLRRACTRSCTPCGTSCRGGAGRILSTDRGTTTHGADDDVGHDVIERDWVSLESPTMPQAGHGPNPCQGLYHRPAGKRPTTALIATHYNVDFSEHYMGRVPGRAGLRVPRVEHPLPRQRGLRPHRERPRSTSASACGGCASRPASRTW